MTRRVVVERSRTVQVAGPSETCTLRDEADVPEGTVGRRAEAEEHAHAARIRAAMVVALDRELDQWEETLRTRNMRQPVEPRSGIQSFEPAPSPPAPTPTEEFACTGRKLNRDGKTCLEVVQNPKAWCPNCHRRQPAPASTMPPQAAPAKPAMPPAPTIPAPVGGWPKAATMRGNERICHHPDHPVARPKVLDINQWDTSVKFYGTPLCVEHVKTAKKVA